jgi:release factor glutamine methyltransferase
MINLKNVYSALYASFRANKVAEPKTSTFVILNKALHRPQRSFRKVPHTPISLFHYNKIRRLALRRLKHEPIEYIAKKLEFKGLSFEVEKPVIIPKPSSEHLIDIALKLVPEKEDPVHFLEVDCGCGAISLTFLHSKPNATGVAIDTSLMDLEVTGKNFLRIFGKDTDINDRLELIQSDFNSFVESTAHKFDIVMASPPCIPSSEWEKLDKGIKLYEHRKDFDGGRYGLDRIWELIRKSSECLKKDGFLVIEMNDGQPEYFEEYFRENAEIAHNLKIFEVKEDSAWKKRFVILQKKVVPKEKQEVPKTTQPKVQTTM